MYVCMYIYIYIFLYIIHGGRQDPARQGPRRGGEGPAVLYISSYTTHLNIYKLQDITTSYTTTTTSNNNDNNDNNNNDNNDNDNNDIISIVVIYMSCNYFSARPCRTSTC